MILPPDDQGKLRFAAISRTALGTRCARLRELGLFYSRLPKLQCDKVIHLGGVTETAAPELARIYPQVEGVTTLELANGRYAPCGGRMAREGRADWVTTPNRIPLTLRPPEGVRNETILCLYYDRSGDRGLSEIADEVMSAASGGGDSPARTEREWGMSGLVPDTQHSYVILVGGQRRLAHRYFSLFGFIGSVGVFDAPWRRHGAPQPYGGTIVEVKLHDDGSLDTCTLIFRDMSGGMPDV